MPASLSAFAAAMDAAAATTKKLAKQSALAAYFRTLDDDADLRLAVRYAAGKPFPATDERTLNVGGSTLFHTLTDLYALDPAAFHQHTIRAGEIGEALSQLWHELTRPASPQPLTLQHLNDAFLDLSSTGNADRKREILRHLFSRCQTGREAAYLTKIIFRDLRTGVQEGLLQASLAEAFAKTLPDIQRTHLLLGDLDAVALLARHDQLRTARFTLFHPIQFMLATPQETPADALKTMAARTFRADDKLDGIRAQVHKSADRIAIYTRTMDRTDESFPDVVDQLKHLPGDFLLDGEIVPYADGQVLPFAHLQRRLGRKTLTPKMLRDNPATFIAFDCLYLNGQLLMDAPLADRLAALHTLSPQLPLITSTEVTTESDIAAAFDAARDRRNEGIVLKDPASPYSPGRRGKNWLKLKTHLPTFDCVVTAAEYGHGKRRAVLSDYTFAVWDRDPAHDGATLVNVGKAFTGLTDVEIAELTPRLLSLATATHGRVHPVHPEIVLEIACDQIQRSTRHASGYALRFPRIKRIRHDKRPTDADRLDRIAQIYASQANFAQRPSPPPTPPEPTLFDHL